MPPTPRKARPAPQMPASGAAMAPRAETKGAPRAQTGGDTPLKAPRPDGATAALVLSDGTVFWGQGIGAAGTRVGEVCFNTSITGYQEILTDPSYAGQIITFTFPHIGNVGTNIEDIETRDAGRARPGHQGVDHRAVQLARGPASRHLAQIP